MLKKPQAGFMLKGQARFGKRRYRLIWVVPKRAYAHDPSLHIQYKIRVRYQYTVYIVYMTANALGRRIGRFFLSCRKNT